MTKGLSPNQRRRRRTVGVAAAGLLVGAMVLGLVFAPRTARAPQEQRTPHVASGERREGIPTVELPMFVASAPSEVQVAYLYAVAHPEVLQYIPCFCGCGAVGHRHNGDCYVRTRHANGKVTFTSHAAT
jgi:hypothetical protein